MSMQRIPRAELTYAVPRRYCPRLGFYGGPVLSNSRFAMMHAQCSCGAVTLTLPGPSTLVVACHCLECQRRTGAPFGVGAFYPVGAVTIGGTPKEFTRAAASGGKVRYYFCPTCGTTV